MKHNLWCGWSGFGRGDRDMALEYGLRAVGLTPWHPEAWRLLVCSLVRGRRPDTTVTDTPEVSLK